MAFTDSLEKKSALAQAQQQMQQECDRTSQVICSYLGGKIQELFPEVTKIDVATSIKGSKRKFDITISQPQGERLQDILGSLHQSLAEIFSSRSIALKPKEHGFAIEGTMGDIQAQIKRNDRAGWEKVKSAEGAAKG